MPSRATALFASVALACVVTGMSISRAGIPQSERAVASVGSVAVRLDELERKMSSMPDIQRAALGWSGPDGARRVLDGLVVPELLYGLAAQARHLEDDAGVRERIDGVLRAARIEELVVDLTVSEAEVAEYYASHRAQFEEPLRLGLWRILCATEEEARRVLSEAQSGINAWRWKDLAREHSIDRATKWRGGDLGYVSADGVSSEVGVQVLPALFAAAESVSDGMLVPEPVAEGEGHAVVWRRETMVAVHRTLEQEASAIQQLLMRRKSEEAVRNLVRSLRQAKHPESHPDLLGALDDVSVTSGASALRPALAASSRSPSGSVRPSLTPRGLR